MLNNAVCESFCNVSSNCGFSKKCLDLGLDYSGHCISLEPLQSLKHVILPLFNISEASFDETHITLMSSTINISNQDLFIEYGKHKRWLTHDMCPNLAIMNKFSIMYETDIFVVCGDLPLKQIHKGNNIIRFSVSNDGLYEQVQRSLRRRENRKVVIGLGGIGIYHPINQPSENDFTVWNRLYDQSIYYESIENNESDDDDTEANVGDQLSEDFYVTSEVVDQNLSENRVNHQSKSISEFLAMNSEKINGQLKIHPSAFINTDKINMDKSHIEALVDGDGLNVNQTYDVDGFYAFAEFSEFAKVFKSGASISPFKQYCDKRTEKCIKSTYSYVGLNILKSAFMTKIAVTEHNNVKFEMFLVAQAASGENPVEFDWDNIVSAAMEESRISPCFNENDGSIIHNGCRSQGLKNSMISSRIASSKNIKAQYYREIYSNETFDCFMFHLRRIVLGRVQDSGLLIPRFDVFIRAIGMKFIFAYNDFPDIWKAIGHIGEVIDIKKLPQKQVILDFCVTTIPDCNNEDVKISLFWNRSGLERSIGEFQRCYYPQLFAGDLSNIHSNLKDDKILKYNIYNCYNDLLLTSSSSNPIKYMQLAKMTALAMSKMSKNDIYKSIGIQYNRLIDEIKNMLLRISSARLRNSSLRAEFRVNINDFSSLFLLIQNKFRSDRITSFFYALKMDDICDLSVFYVNMLSEPIFRSLLKIIGGTNLGMNEVMKNLGTIVLFESLLSFTLFNGSTFNMARELAWSSENVNSFNLMKYIFTLNRPFFERSKWNLDLYCISEDNVQLFKSLLSRISKGDVNLISHSFEMYFVLRNEKKTDNEKAEALWKAYYASLPLTDLLNARTLFPWRKENLSSNIRFRERHITINEAIEKLFDPKMLIHCPWQKPYLMGFDELSKSAAGKSVEQRINEIKAALKTVACEKLCLEVIRYPGDEKSFLGRGSTYIDLSYEEHSECLPTFFFDDTAQRTSKIGAEILNSLKNVSNDRKIRGRGVTFSLNENIQLVLAYNTHGPGSWSRIVKDDRFIFAANGLRTSDNLRTRWRNMEKTLQFDEFWFIQGYKNECSPKELCIARSSFSRSPSNVVRINSQGNIIENLNLQTNHGPQHENDTQEYVFDDSLNDNLANNLGNYSNDNVNLRTTELIADTSNSSYENNSEDIDHNSVPNSSNLVILTEQSESLQFNASPINDYNSTVIEEYVDSQFNANISESESESENDFEVSVIERELALTNPIEAVKRIAERIHSIFGEKYAFKVYRIATEYTDESCSTWKQIYRSLSSKIRDKYSWNLFKRVLLNIGLIEENDSKLIIRKF